MKRRDFLALLAGAAVAWPVPARAQPGDRVRRIGVLMVGDENDPLRNIFVSGFTQALAGLGWTVGRNVRMDLRWAGDDINRMRALAQELVGLQPDIILTGGTPATVAIQRETRTIPIVFANAGRSRRRWHRRAARPPEWEHYRLRRLGTLAGRQVA
jgi:putative ABC transport system substrate-binding protein